MLALVAECIYKQRLAQEMITCSNSLAYQN